MYVCIIILIVLLYYIILIVNIGSVYEPTIVSACIYKTDTGARLNVQWKV